MMSNEYMILIKYIGEKDFVLLQIGGRDQVALEENKHLLAATGNALLNSGTIAAYMIVMRCGPAIYPDSYYADS